MKKLFILLFTLVLAACKPEPKDYVTLSGKITDKSSDSLVIRTRTYSKTIKVNEDGTFSDTLKVETGIHNFYDGKESTSIFLKNGFDLNITLDTKEFDETIKYSGHGAESNNYLAKKALLQEALFKPALFDMEETDFKTKTKEIYNQFSELIGSYENLDSTILTSEKAGIEKLQEGLLGAFKQQQARANKFADLIGKPSPAFEDYENYKGGTTSLADLKGKYVYVDVWATWCGPCIAEIPSLKKLEKQYHGKNIQFVSLSVDDGRGYKADTKEESFALAKEGWKKMIAEKELGGIQILSPNGWQSQFVQGYKISGIPRFILIGPDGNIVTPDAPRPSSEAITKLFGQLGI